MTYDTVRRVFRCAMLIAPLCVAISAQADDEQSYWSSVLSRQRAIYDAIHSLANDYEASKSKHREGEQLRAELIQRLQTNASLARVVRKSLRNDDRAWVRGFSIAILIKAFGKQSADDAIFALSDPDIEGRGFALGGILAARVEGAGSSVAASLLSKDAAERSTALSAARDFLGPKGLPYYSALLYDPEPKVAEVAADGFRSCKKEDAAPHLLRYLTMYGKTTDKNKVTQAVVEALSRLYREAPTEGIDLNQAVSNWITRLEKELKGGS